MLVSLVNKAGGLKACNSVTKRLQHMCFPVKFEKFLRTTSFTEEFEWLLLRLLTCVFKGVWSKNRCYFQQ